MNKEDKTLMHNKLTKKSITKAKVIQIHITQINKVKYFKTVFWNNDHVGIAVSVVKILPQIRCA